MINILKSWNVKKHILLSIGVAVGAEVIFRFLPVKEAASIGIIGSADGPTAIYVSNGTLNFLYHNIIFALFFCFIMVLYIPVKVILKNQKW